MINLSSNIPAARITPDLRLTRVNEKKTTWFQIGDKAVFVKLESPQNQGVSGLIFELAAKLREAAPPQKPVLRH